MAELTITKYQIGEIEFNLEELKKELTEKVAFYKNLAYSEDNIRECKADHARLKALVNALDNERKKRKKEFLAPLERFEAQIKDLQSVINEPLAIIDKQLDAFEKVRKDRKQATVENWWRDTYVPTNSIPSVIESITDIWDERWMNATCSMKQIEKDVTERLKAIAADIEMIKSLPEYSFEAMEIYKDGLDLRRALAEGKRLADIQARKEASKITADIVNGSTTAQNADKLDFNVDDKETHSEQEKATETATASAEQPKMWWVTFRAHITAAQAHELKAFFETRGIEYEAKKE